MLFETFAVFTGAAILFGAVAALKPDGRFLFGTAAFLILTGGMVLSSGTLEVHDGWNETGHKVVNKTQANEEIIDHNLTQEKVYRDLDEDYGFDLPVLLSLLYFALAVGAFLIASYSLETKGVRK